MSLLRAAGVPSVLLRGAALSARLYGDATVRPSGDLDLLVDAARWSDADAVLRGAGWTRAYGAPGAETAYRRRAGAGDDAIELHPSVCDGPLLSHLPTPAVESEVVTLPGGRVRAYAGPFLPATLALHAAKHVLPPLLWFVDFATLWSSLDAGARAAAFASARRHRVHRYLAWAIGRAECATRAAAGDHEALVSLGYARRGERRDGHNAMRVAMLAGTPADVCRVAVGWAVPVVADGTVRTAIARTAQRAMKPFAGLASRARGYASAGGAPATAFRLDAPLQDVVREVVGGGGSLWITATGDSMRPALPPGARVRLVPPDASLAPGAIAFAVLPGGGAVLHRITGVEGGRICLRGDDTARADLPVTRDAVLAVVDRVEVDGVVGPPPARPMLSLLDARRAARSALRALGGGAS